MDGWKTFSFPFGAFRPFFRGEMLVSGSVSFVGCWTIFVKLFFFIPQVYHLKLKKVSPFGYCTIFDGKSRVSNDMLENHSLVGMCLSCFLQPSYPSKSNTYICIGPLPKLATKYAMCSSKYVCAMFKSGYKGNGYLTLKRKSLYMGI